MKRLIILAAVALASFVLDRLLAAWLFETNVVASLLAPSSSTALSSALLALTFLLNRVFLYVALPGIACFSLTHLAIGRLKTRPSGPPVPQENASP